MRITCLSVSDQLGGSEAVLLRMITALERVRPEWQFQVVLPGRGPLHESLKRTRAICSVVPMPARLSRLGEWSAVQDGWSAGSQVALGIKLCGTATALPAYESRLHRVVAEFDPDVVHTNGFKAHVLGARMPTPHGQLVWHLHEYVSRRRLTCWLLRRYGSRCSAVVANSRSVAADATEWLGRVRAPQVVTNAVDLSVFSPEGPRLDLDRLANLPAAPADVVRVGLLATYGRWKGHEVFLDAMQQLRTQVAIRGYIIGGPIYDTANSQFTRADLQRMIAARDLNERVGLTGFVDAAPAMRALDIVVHASTEPEPFGLVIAESMACGRPVITTGRGGAGELISDGRDGVVSPPGDVRALARCIDELAVNRTRRLAIGEHARQTACLRFTSETFASEVARLFERVISHSRVARSA
jgi:glycosyltransferase involved in cell wall biosynthesis